MPYIKQEDRDALDQGLEALWTVLAKTSNPIDIAGSVNYVVTRIIVRATNQKRSYATMALMIGTLVCCILEYYRRFVSGYEDEAVIRNGDIPEYRSKI